jgi:hypothetical protein
MMSASKRDAPHRRLWLALGAAAIAWAGLPQHAAAQRSIELGILGAPAFSPTAALATREVTA